MPMTLLRTVQPRDGGLTHTVAQNKLSSFVHKWGIRQAPDEHLAEIPRHLPVDELLRARQLYSCQADQSQRR